MQRSAPPHKQNDYGKLSIQREKPKYGLHWRQKKFNGEPNEWFLKVLYILKRPPMIITFLRYRKMAY